MTSRLLLAALAAVICVASPIGTPARGADQSSHSSAQTAKTASVIGYSADHRPIVAILIAPSRARRSMLVVGSIAGDEPGGIAVTQALASQTAIEGVRLWLLPDVNPDGARHATRVNANGVDLNRNFPFRWRRLGPPGSRYYSGQRPASEPETRAVEAFILRVRPGLAVWLHQPYGLIDDSQGPRWAEQLLARITHLPLMRLADYPGSAIGWNDHIIARSAFDVELPGGPLTTTMINSYAADIRTLAQAWSRRR